LTLLGAIFVFIKSIYPSLIKIWIKEKGAVLMCAQGWVGQAHKYLHDLPSKKSSLQKIFGSNLFLHDKKVQEKASSPYAALRAARQNFLPFQTSHIRVALYYQIRTYFKNL